MLKTKLAAAAVIATLGVMGTGAASASTPQDAAAPATPAKATALADHPCWTSFDPPNPDGAGMWQFYRNCTNREVTVCAQDIEDGYLQPNHISLPPGWVGKWHWERTTRGHHYTTIYC
ncbi:hypothetical protein [Streptomyces sp. CT34]|uniref:hypothetical protein n=1 Tax=Streptomyces sp. CT34 TaxID=1553907 RepID=UPI0012FEC454|nr:hypothetical protein [Streptomyces sp. CT34]